MLLGPKKTLCVVLPLELYHRLKDLSRQNIRTMSSYVRWILEQHLQHLDYKQEANGTREYQSRGPAD